jgi:hypothetical protein
MLQAECKEDRGDQHLYYLEVLGETEPLFDQALASAQGRDDAKTVSPAIYEYQWTLGRVRTDPDAETALATAQTETAQEADEGRWRKAAERLSRHAHRGGWEDLDEEGYVQVHLLFPHPPGWRVSELAVSFKYVAPLRPVDSVILDVEKGLAPLEPLLGLAGVAANAAGSLGAGSIASAAGHTLCAIAKTKINSIAPSKEFPWWVQTTAGWSRVSDAQGELVDGVAWTLPVKLLQAIGTRATGTIAVSFAQLDGSGAKSDCPLRAWAILPTGKGEGGPLRLPKAKGEYVELPLHPR